MADTTLLTEVLQALRRQLPYLQFNAHRKSVRDLEENIMSTRRRLNDNLLQIKRAEAALEDMRLVPPVKAYTQAGQAFMNVHPDELQKNLVAGIESHTKQRAQLVEIEAKFVERLKNKKAELEGLEQKIRAYAVAAK